MMSGLNSPFGRRSAARDDPPWADFRKGARLTHLFTILFLAALFPPASAAQTVQGQVVVSGTGEPLEGALVSLVNLHENQVDRYITNSAGRFRVRSPEPGTFTVRVERIGFETVTSAPSILGEGESIQVTLHAAEKPIQLEALRVEGSRRCVVRPGEGLALSRLWDEARKALTAQQWTEEMDLTRFRVRGYQRELDPQTRLTISETSHLEEWATRNPIRSIPVADLLRDGFIQRDDRSGYTYYGPDAAVLLSDEFLDTHCFRVRFEENQSGWVGLAFEPLRERSTPDIEGTLWLDGKTARLQYLEFGYTWSPWAEAMGVAEGRVYFEEVPEGGWIVRRWWIRMPKVVQDVGLLVSGGSGFSVRGISEAGGEVEILSPRRLAVNPKDAGGLWGVVWDSIRSAPLSAAQVFLSGTQYSATSDSSGTYRLSGVPTGSYRAVFTHPTLDSIGVFPTGEEVTVKVGETVELPLSIPSRESLLKALCSEAGWAAGTSAIVGAVKDSRTGAPVSGATVSLEWTNYQAVANREIRADVQTVEVTSDGRGRYRACGIPSSVIVTARARIGEVEGPAVRETVPAENILVLGLTIAAAGVYHGRGEPAQFMDMGDHPCGAIVIWSGQSGGAP